MKPGHLPKEPKGKHEKTIPSWFPVPTVERLILIGSSAGGPRILKELFRGMPRLKAAVILIQHMPRFINESIREILSELTEMEVSLAQDGEILREGHLYIAPSEKHLRVVDNRKIVLASGEKVNFVCPSIDVAFLSVHKHPAQKVMGIILTGMGKDGTEGIRHLKKIGGMTIAQDEKTSVIFGMPKEAIDTGHVDLVLTPSQIREEIIAFAGIFKKKMV